MEHATPAVTVTARRDGFHRCGVPHPASPVEYPAGHWSEEQLERLRAEPMLVVADTADGPAADVPADTLDRTLATLRAAPAGKVRKILRHLSKDLKIRTEIGAAAGRRSRLVAAVAGLDPDNPDHFIRSGKPGVRALEAASGLTKVSAAERDAAWEDHRQTAAAA